MIVIWVLYLAEKGFTMVSECKERKLLIVDTSVLLYDCNSIHSFPENDVLIPLVVLDELDRFKDKKGLVGENARYINRYLDDVPRNIMLHKRSMYRWCDTVECHHSARESTSSTYALVSTSDGSNRPT